MSKAIYFQDLGIKDYESTWRFQEELLQQIVAIKTKNRSTGSLEDTPNYFLFVEHPSLYTIGKSGDLSNLLLSQKQMEDQQLPLYPINRGGDITYHGPGQVIGYPILDLENFFTDIHKYLRSLEEVVIRTLAEFGIEGERSAKETGVWIAPNTPSARKICAMGIRTSRWVTMHGFALNANVDLSYFENIIPCGIKGKSVTSINKELGVSLVSQESIKKHIITHFEDVFQSKFIAATLRDT